MASSGVAEAWRCAIPDSISWLFRARNEEAVAILLLTHCIGGDSFGSITALSWASLGD